MNGGNSFCCQCRRFPESPELACTARVTREDLLCDTCRDGCNAAIGITEGPFRHMRAELLSVELRRAHEQI